MSKKKQETQIQEFENVQNALSKSEAFIEKNQKVLLYGFIAVILAVCAVLGYQNYYMIPKEKEAQELIFKAEQHFAKDSFQLALDGDGENLGFLAIINEYGMTQTADLARAYAGISYKALGEYEKAISYLKLFDEDDMVLTPALKGAIGDCYLELNENDKAISFFQKAVASNNEIISPLYLQRIALVHISTKNYTKAISVLEELKSKYANSQEGMNADKFIQLATDLK